MRNQKAQKDTVSKHIKKTNEKTYCGHTLRTQIEDMQ